MPFFESLVRSIPTELSSYNTTDCGKFELGLIQRSTLFLQPVEIRHLS